MSKTPMDWSKALVKELYKHATKDDCYNCKQILKAMGLDPKKSIDAVLNPKE